MQGCTHSPECHYDTDSHTYIHTCACACTCTHTTHTHTYTHTHTHSSKKFILQCLPKQILSHGGAREEFGWSLEPHQSFWMFPTCHNKVHVTGLQGWHHSYTLYIMSSYTSFIRCGADIILTSCYKQSIANDTRTFEWSVFSESHATKKPWKHHIEPYDTLFWWGTCTHVCSRFLGM